MFRRLSHRTVLGALLLLFLTIVAGGLWVSQQEDCAQLILARHGSLSGPPRSPVWLHHVLSIILRTGATVHNTDVRTVSLQDTHATDADIQHLIRFGDSQLVNLEVLNLENTPITDVALRNIGAFLELKRLNLEGTMVSDFGLESVAELAKLSSLNLEGTQITDVGLKSISGLIHLEELSLNRTAVTDVGLRQLRGLTQLKTLDLRRTDVSMAAVDELQAAVPSCDILSAHSDAL